MKKLLLTSLCTCWAFTGISAQQNTEINCLWAKLIDGATAAGDQSTQVVVDSKGNPVWYGTYGTKEDQPDIDFGGEFLYTGAPYPSFGTSYCSNYTLLKTDSDGNKLWLVYSNSGDFENNAGGCAVTSDDGVVTVAKMRHTDGMLDKPIVLVDGAGTSHTLDWTVDGDKRIYRIFVSKVSSAGVVEWFRCVDLSTEPGPGASGNYVDMWPNCFNIGTPTVDSEDNIYLSINFKNPITFQKADGTTRTFTPVNNKTWSGDSQVAAGDFMIAKLDANGYFVNALTLDGTAASALCQRLVYKDGYIYAQGMITGDGTTLKAGNFTLSPSNIMSPVVMKVNPDLDVIWAKCFPASQVNNKNALQNVGLNVSGNTLWMCGQYNLKFTDADDETKFVSSTQGNIREGFVLKLDAETGQWIAARNSRDDDWNYPSVLAKTGLTGYFDIICGDNQSNKIYVFGYVMNAAVGVFIREYNAETLEGNLTDGQTTVVTGGGVPSCQTITYDRVNNSVYLTARGNKAFNVKNSENAGVATDAPKGWGILAAKYTMPSDMSSITDGLVTDKIIDNAPEYYDLQGRRINGTPDTGFYIKRCGSNTEKILVR